jgi:DNA-binding NarL/FixJ family response regulator
MLVALHRREQAMSLADRIKVLIVHTEAIARAGLTVALAACADIDVLRDDDTSEGGRSVLAWRERSPADVVVADYGRGMDLLARPAGATMISKLPKVLIVSGNDREWEIRAAMHRGIRGYLLLGCSLNDLACAVRAVRRGSRHFCPEVRKRLADSMSNGSLTTREQHVLQLVVDGLDDKGVAECLGIAVGTVDTHLRAAFEKLRVETRIPTRVAAGQRGLLREIARRKKEAKGLQCGRSSVIAGQSVGCRESRMAVTPE